jgi:hypothetical protein
MRESRFLLGLIVGLALAVAAAAAFMRDVLVEVFVEPLFGTLRWLFKPAPVDLNLVRLTPAIDVAVDTDARSRVRAFMDHARGLAAYMGGGFNTDAYRAALAV